MIHLAIAKVVSVLAASYLSSLLRLLQWNESVLAAMCRPDFLTCKDCTPAWHPGQPPGRAGPPRLASGRPTGQPAQTIWRLLIFYPLFHHKFIECLLLTCWAVSPWVSTIPIISCCRLGLAIASYRSKNNHKVLNNKDILKVTSITSDAFSIQQILYLVICDKWWMALLNAHAGQGWASKILIAVATPKPYPQSIPLWDFGLSTVHGPGLPDSQDSQYPKF